MPETLSQRVAGLLVGSSLFVREQVISLACEIRFTLHEIRSLLPAISYRTYAISSIRYDVQLAISRLLLGKGSTCDLMHSSRHEMLD